MTLHAITPPVPETALTLAERLVDMIKAGEVSSLAIATVNRDGTVTADWSECFNAPALAGAISRLAHRFNLQLDDE